jgi:hypothetical protein
MVWKLSFTDRPPLERIISYYYFYFKYYGRRYRDKVVPSIQDMDPAQALRAVSRQGVDKFYYHHMPILTLFGDLSADAVVVRTLSCACCFVVDRLSVSMRDKWDFVAILG